VAVSIVSAILYYFKLGHVSAFLVHPICLRGVSYAVIIVAASMYCECVVQWYLDWRAINAPVTGVLTCHRCTVSGCVRALCGSYQCAIFLSL